MSPSSLCLLLFGSFLLVVEGSFEVPHKPKLSLCERGCFNGVCRNGTCACDSGWTGAQCESCFGRQHLYGKSSGVISHGVGNYSVNLRCSWLIDGRSIGARRVSLSLDSFSTECSWDHVYVYEGDGIWQRQLAAFSGILQQQKIPRELIVDSPTAYVYFYSDTAYNMTGFNISYRFDSCPNGCNQHGNCTNSSTSTGVSCFCNPGWTGADCSVPLCQYGSNKAAVVAKVESDDHRRSLQPTSLSCPAGNSSASWEVLPSADHLGPRSSHGSVVVGSRMFVFGGDYFPGTSEYEDFLVYDFTTTNWQPVGNYTDDLAPTTRYDHSLVLYKDRIYLYGGVIYRRLITAELWEYDVTHNRWANLTSDHQSDSKVPPYAAAGHTAHVVEGVMLIFFGYNPTRGFLCSVQEYNFEQKTWASLTTTGALPKCTYGHISVQDDQSQFIYVYSGYYGLISTAGKMSDSLYSYKTSSKEWKLLQGSGHYHYLMSGVLMNGLFIILGGNANNETQPIKPTQCYAQFALTYDIECGIWQLLSLPKHLPSIVSRYGHTGVVYSGSMYIFGGFNGQMLADLVKFTPGNCQFITENSPCLRSTEGRRCYFDGVCTNYDNHSKGSKDLCNMLITNQIFGIGANRPCEDFNDDCLTCRNNVQSCNFCDEAAKCIAWAERCPSESSKKLEITSVVSRNCTKYKGICERYLTCTACSTISECRWSHEQPNKHSTTGVCELDLDSSEASKYLNSKTQSAEGPLATMKVAKNRVCPASCSSFSDCGKCIESGNCMWCGNLQRCIDINAYSPSYPYGQCLHWATKLSGCDGPNTCSSQLTCSNCQSFGPGCGWCDDGSNTGLGTCLPGSMSGPLAWNETESDSFACPNTRWYFIECPACQCNGHGTCANATGSADRDFSPPLICQGCRNLTTGDRCDTCMKGYWGNALNGGSCSACSCNGHAKDCHPLTGRCFCTTKGVTGDHCERCDASGKYIGDPRNDTCLYELTIDFVFTFTLNSDEDLNMTQISFVNKPLKEGTPVAFKLECQTSSGQRTPRVNLTIYSSAWLQPRMILRNVICNKLERQFDAEEFKIGGDFNTSFVVAVFDFTTPILLQISFAQSPAIDWVKFFITFASCFLSLLVVAAIFWKVKLRWDLYRRRQRMFVEMAQMASRPFGCVQLELPKDVLKAGGKQQASPLCIEPCANYKAAVVTIAVRLPTGRQRYTPSGQSGLAIASTLTTLIPPYLAQLQTPPSPPPEVKRRKPACIS